MAVPSSVLAAGWIPFVVILVAHNLAPDTHVTYHAMRMAGSVLTMVIEALASSLLIVYLSNSLLNVTISRVISLSTIYCLHYGKILTATMKRQFYHKLVLIFSTAYIKYFMSKYDSTISSTISAIVALSITLLTTALVPVDVFLVSYMKERDGHFKDWANDTDTRRSIENTVTYGYYTLYALIVFCLFLLLPFMYFFYEEKDEETSTKVRCCSALKYTLAFIFIVAVLLLIGIFVPSKTEPSSNSTDWKKIEALFKNLSSNRFEDSLSFIISCLSLLGMCGLVTYTAYGMSALPMGFIKGRKGAKKERLQVQSQRSETRERIQAIRDKYSGRGMSGRRRENLSDLEESERLMERRERHLVDKETSVLQKCLIILRPFEIIFGVFFFLITLIIFLSLLLTNIDKAMHSLGYKLGYALPRRSLPNPVDIILVFLQRVFPLDYVMFSLLVLYIVLCSLAGVRNIGIWFFWLKMYKIHPRRTRPQGILMLCMILMFIMLAVNIIIYELTPQYSTFGSQRYMVSRNTTSGNSTSESEVCTTEAADCVISRMTLLLTRFFYKMWFFGAAYYWVTWAFLGFMLIGFIVAVIKKRKSAIDGEVDEDDFDDSDDDMLPP